MESKQEVTKTKQVVIKKEVKSDFNTKAHTRGKLSNGMTKSTNQMARRPSRLPLLRTTSTRLVSPCPHVQSESVKSHLIRDGGQYKRTPASGENKEREKQEVTEKEKEVKIKEVMKIKKRY